MAFSNKRVQTLQQTFLEAFGKSPEVIARAPGRVNLIGEHTDYNDGYVLPIAIDRDVLVAMSKSKDNAMHMYSVDFNRVSACQLNDIRSDAEENPWSNYLRGVAGQLLKRGMETAGINIAIEGNVPFGTGLGSSAAVQVAAAMAFQAVYKFEMTGIDMAQMCQTAENEFVGVNCGIMDPFISRLGQKNHATFIDCRTLASENVPLPSRGVKVVVVNSMKKRGLVDSEYNDRHEQCRQAVTTLKHILPNMEALRDIGPKEFSRYKMELPPTARRRAEHVVLENDRVLRGVEALKKNDIKLFGKLMDESHASLRDLFEVTSRELDLLVSIAKKVPGVYGARMMGAGFGGCTVNLVADDALPEFKKHVAREYEYATGLEPNIYVCSADRGAEVLAQRG